MESKLEADENDNAVFEDALDGADDAQFEDAIDSTNTQQDGDRQE